jgi:hypothetical protein
MRPNSRSNEKRKARQRRIVCKYRGNAAAARLVEEVE